MLQVRTKIDDNINPDYPWSIDYTDYFYYDHDGVVAEQQENGNTKYFTRAGRELLSCKDNGGNYFYIQNARGDVIMLVNASGTTAAIRDYDSTGRLLGRAPDERTDRDPFGFTGGLDAGKGLWKLGARFYDSSKSSFIQQDRYMGDPSDPLSLNRYVYCGMDPVNYVDPTGFYDWPVHVNMTSNAALAVGFNPIADRVFIRQMEIANHFTDNNLGKDYNRHYNTNTSGDDSRVEAAMAELSLAEGAWNNGDTESAALHLGQGLHSIQDMSAHIGLFGSNPIMHSIGNNLGMNPDNDLSRTPEALANSEDYLNLFRNDVGLNNN